MKRQSPTKARAPAAPRSRARNRLTPLARTLMQETQKRATPLDAFTLARRKWLAGERLDIGLIANELGVGRATMFRWVGSREQLYGEILSAEYTRERSWAAEGAVGHGPDLVADIVRRALGRLLASAPLRHFIEHDPEFAIRVLTSKSSPVQARCIELECAFLRELERRGQIRPALDVETLGYIIVRICESFLYGDVISGREPDIEKAAAAIRILVAAEAPKSRSRVTALRARLADVRTAARGSEPA